MRQVQKVRVNLLEEAMRRHQESLLDLLSEGAYNAIPFPLHIDRLYTAKSLPTPLELDGIKAIALDGQYDQVILSVEEGHKWKLLRQHLRRDKLYTHLKRWKQTMLEVDSEEVWPATQNGGKLYKHENGALVCP